MSIKSRVALLEKRQIDAERRAFLSFEVLSIEELEFWLSHGYYPESAGAKLKSLPQWTQADEMRKRRAKEFFAGKTDDELSHYAAHGRFP
jgi:hypothetical protein